jgi:WD40 repeat protein/transcriptional regulator with XRE-family HTH domain
LKYLRRREHLTQLELSIAVGYSEAQITRLEKNYRRPDLAAVRALFVPALHIEKEPDLIARLLDLAETARQLEAPAQGMPPFKGLLFFDEADADLFFGREALTARLAGHVMDLTMDASTRFLAVVGASGSGKSSLVRAGLAVALMRSGWDVRVFTPTANPLGSLESNLPAAPAVVADHVLLVVDQFEEVFTLCRDEMERIAFIEQLLTAAQDQSRKTIVAIALRADFYSNCARYPSLRRAVAAKQEFIGGMTAAELRRAIEEPAKHGGWTFEPGLVDVLLRDIGAQGASEPEPGALPLLSHALLATWERRRGRTVTLEGYHASGGVHGAIAETAESVFTDQLDQHEQARARDLFLRLTKLGEGTEDTRRRATLNELVSPTGDATQLRRVLNTLAEARLVILNEDTAEIAHEALIREWQRLRQWLTQDREGLLLHRHLTESAHEWERRGRDSTELYRGARLAQVREWTSTHRERLNALEEAFLAASIDQESRAALEREAQNQRELETARQLAQAEKDRADEQATSVKRLRQRGLFLAGALALALIAATFANAFARNAQQQALISSVRELSNAAILNLEVDPERSILLALQAVNKTLAIDRGAQPEAEDALHRAVQASRVELTLRGHTDVVWSAVFSPDGTRVATASADGTAKIWDATTGEDLLTLKGSDYGIVWDAVFSPDGEVLATAGQDGMVHLWNARTGQEVSRLVGHAEDVFHVEFSPKGSRIATISPDGTARIWDALTGKELLRLDQGSDAVPYWVAFRPDGLRIAVANTRGSNEGWVSVWDVVTGEMLFSLPDQNAFVDSVAFSPDGARMVTTSDDQTVRIWDANSGELRQTFYGQTTIVTNAAYSPDGAQIATVLGNGQVSVVDAATGREVLTLAGHSSNIRMIAFSPDGTRLVTASSDKTARVWDLGPSREVLTLTNGPAILSQVGAKLAYSPDGTQLAVAYSDPIAKVWEVRTGELLFRLAGHTDEVLFIAYSFDGSRLVTASRDGTAKVWDATSGKELLTLSGHTNAVAGAAFSPDGSRLATASFDGTAKIWDAETGQEILTLRGHTDWLASVVFSADGTRIATSSFDGTAIVWDAMTGKRLLTLHGHTNTVRQVVFNPDGTRLGTAGLDGNAKLWDAQTGKELLTLSGHAGQVLSIAFSPDGKIVATAGGDRTAELRDSLTGKGLLTLHAPDGLTSVAFSPDGSQLAVASRDGTARIYLLKIEDLVALAKQRVTRSLTKEECQEYLHTDACPR